jgi:hypothetical protein
MNSTGSGYGQNLGPCGQDNAISGSLQRGEFLEQLGNSRFLILDSPIVNYVGSYLFICLVGIVGWLVIVSQADRQAISDVSQDTRYLAEIRIQNLGPLH